MCPECGRNCSPKDTHCPECNCPVVNDGVQPLSAPEKGKQYNPFGLDDYLYLPRNRRVAGKKLHRVRDTFVSEEIKQCPIKKRKKQEDVDRILEITKSCEDLAIDD